MNNYTFTKTCSALSVVAVLATTVPSAALAAQPCATPRERSGLELRVLQSELMVAALTCGQRKHYNTFVSTFKPQIKKQSANLKAYFKKAYGAGATQKLNKLITRLANQASQRSLSQPTSKFCATMEARFEKVLSTQPAQLISLAQSSPTANAHGVHSCTMQVKTEELPKSPETRVVDLKAPANSSSN